jgi:taurine dioxygenase
MSETMSATPFIVRHLSVGAEVIGLSEESYADPAVKSALYVAWLDYGILLFRNVHSAEQHLALSRCFGDLEEHPIKEVRAEEGPLFMRVSGGPGRPYVYDETALKVNTIAWHRDTAYTPNICKGAMLRMLEVPSSEGETMFADTALAYDDLPEEVKSRLRGLEYKSTLRSSPMEQTQPGALWNSVRPPTSEEFVSPDAGGVDFTTTLKDAFPSVVHPAVVVHPESGRTCIFLSPKEFDRFLGLDKTESDELFAYLVSHMLQDRYVYKHPWSPDDAIVWDNRRFMHAAAGNSVGDHRRGLRTTLTGEMRVGRFYVDKAPADQDTISS